MSAETETVKVIVEITPFLKGVYIFANIAYTVVLIWGFKNVSAALKGPASNPQNSGQVNPLPQSTGWNNMLQSNSPTNGTTPSIVAGTQQSVSSEPDISYARVSGAIGSIAIASLFVGMSYWLLYALFFGTGKGAYDIGSKINAMGGFFISGAALFLPSAFDRLSSIFKT